MKPNVRACIAYTAGRLILEKECDSITDHTLGKNHIINGIVDALRVEIEEAESKYKFLGQGYNNMYEINNLNEQCMVELTITGKTFKGYDFGCFSHFQGEVEDDFIRIFDNEVQSQFDYQL